MPGVWDLGLGGSATLMRGCGRVKSRLIGIVLYRTRPDKWYKMKC